MRVGALIVTVFASSLAAQEKAPRAWWLSGQLNIIYQWHPAFDAPYTGANSLHATSEHATSFVATLYSGLRIGSRTELHLDLESAGGGGISQASGLAGFTDLDVVRNPTLGASPYLARALIRYSPIRQLAITAGKLGVVDYFDLNTAGSDSHLQFMNWTVDNSGAYDYAADTRGYTIAMMAEFRDHAWAARWAEALMPLVANGIRYDWNVAHAHADNLEIELDRGVVPGHDGVVRVLGYLNHARMGSYQEALDAYAAGRDPLPDVAAHRRVGRRKLGGGVNVEQAVGRGFRVFGRASENDGRVESFAYTEVDRSLAVGLGWVQPSGNRGNRLGLALVTNGLASQHRDYLARGGLGFLLGDGALRYGPERIVEAYYTRGVGNGLSLAFDVQHITDPGYNRDRGPVTVISLRAHVDVPDPGQMHP